MKDVNINDVADNRNNEADNGIGRDIPFIHTKRITKTYGRNRTFSTLTNGKFETNTSTENINVNEFNSECPRNVNENDPHNRNTDHDNTLISKPSITVDALHKRIENLAKIQKQ